MSTSIRFRIDRETRGKGSGEASVASGEAIFELWDPDAGRWFDSEVAGLFRKPVVRRLGAMKATGTDSSRAAVLPLASPGFTQFVDRLDNQILSLIGRTQSDSFKWKKPLRMDPEWEQSVSVLANLTQMRQALSPFCAHLGTKKMAQKYRGFVLVCEI